MLLAFASASAKETYTVHVLDAAALEMFDRGERAQGDTLEVDGFFTLLWSEKSKVDDSAKVWEDGYAPGRRVNFGGAARTDKNAVRFTLPGPAVIKVWWVQGGESSPDIGILNSEGTAVARDAHQYKSNKTRLSEFSLKKASTYYLGGLSGNDYIFKVEAVLPGPVSAVLQENEAGGGSDWAFTAFGTKIREEYNGFAGSAEEGAVRVWSTDEKGVLNPDYTDGLAFYCVKLDPRAVNFTLTATANVNEWTCSSGKEGFGLMAADAIGVHGDSSPFWNNCYMAAVTGLEYRWEGETIVMRLGVGAREKTGVRPENITAEKTLRDMSAFSSGTAPLDTSCGPLGAGTYNLVGNCTNTPAGTVRQPQTSFSLTVGKNNTGYFVGYTAPDGGQVIRKYYDPEALSRLDAEGVYVGFFAARNADVTFTDIALSTSSPAEDPPAEEPPLTLAALECSVVSPHVANTEKHTLEFYCSADGFLTVADDTGAEIVSWNIQADKKAYIPVTLAPGENNFAFCFTPDSDFRPSSHALLESYAEKTFIHTVVYAVNRAPVVWVAPGGSGGGTREDPADLSRAVREAVPGQRIILLPGRYLLDKLVIERGISGSANKPIWLEADPDAAERPVLDFDGKGAGLTLAGDFWRLSGFDVTGTRNKRPGVLVCGSHNVLTDLRAYRNGNTGIQISRYKKTDLREEWPADNLVRGCSAWLNADKEYSDADGFAAKISCGSGNVFDGCIACYNADDGFDLYARLETGPVGPVVIQNCLSFKNGYVLDEEGGEIRAGDGNGFKLGGQSVSGRHRLINSIAFANKSRGIDANTCPDIRVERCTSFDNEGSNVAFYTSTAINTDYAADGVLSFKRSNDRSDSFTLLGTQDPAKVYGPTNYYVKSGLSQNSEGREVREDWFVSLDTDAAIHGGIVRDPDGAIRMNGFLTLTESAPEAVGARIDTTN